MIISSSITVLNFFQVVQTRTMTSYCTILPTLDYDVFFFKNTLLNYMSTKGRYNRKTPITVPPAKNYEIHYALL